MAAEFDISNFNLVSGDDLIINTRYYIVDEEYVCAGIYQGRDEHVYTFIADNGEFILPPTFIARIVFYVPKQPARVRRMDKAS